MATIVLDQSTIGQTIAPAPGWINCLIRQRAPTALSPHPADGTFWLTQGAPPYTLIHDGAGGIMSAEIGHAQSPDGAILIGDARGTHYPFTGPLVCKDVPKGQSFRLVINE